MALTQKHYATQDILDTYNRTYTFCTQGLSTCTFTYKAQASAADLLQQQQTIHCKSKY